MEKNEPVKNNALDYPNGESISDLSYLTEMMNGNKDLIKGVIDDFLVQIPGELSNINSAIERSDFPLVKKFTHSMKSSVSILGISRATVILKEMEDLSAKESDIEKIKNLNDQLNLTCQQAIEEIEADKYNYS